MRDVAVGMVINEFKHVLITLRSASSSSCPSLWEFPGGKIEVGETAEHALIRELQEEVNVSCHHAKFWLAHEDNGVRLHVFWVNHFSGQARCLENQQALKWASVNDLSKYAFPPSNQLLINKMQLSDGFS